MGRPRTYESAADRWAGVGPYYAMFPIPFADKIVQRYTQPGDVVLDPFAGRGTSIFSAATHGRGAIGVEINPVGWVYARTKLDPAERDDVEARLEELGRRARRFGKLADGLPAFFSSCFARRVREFLVAARELLDWRKSRVDRTTMALLLVHLHGKREFSLSNQMRQAKSLYPDYAIRWWRERRLRPPDLEPVKFMVGKLDWRYARGTPEVAPSSVYLGDSTTRLKDIARRRDAGGSPAASLLFTSPPYYSVTNYHHDQWLRLWLLGGAPNALRTGERSRGKFDNRPEYRSLLLRVFQASASLLAKDAVVYVRTHAREFTYKTTRDVLREVFPEKRLRRRPRPFSGPSQTDLFGNAANKQGEVDLVLVPER